MTASGFGSAAAKVSEISAARSATAGSCTAAASATPSAESTESPEAPQHRSQLEAGLEATWNGTVMPNAPERRAPHRSFMWGFRTADWASDGLVRLLLTPEGLAPGPFLGECLQVQGFHAKRGSCVGRR